MDLAMLIHGSKRLCASTKGAESAQNSTSPSINPGPAFAMENPDMKGSLWSRLPEHLIERVLAWLPAASLLRLWTVCREWSEIVATKCFLEVCSQVASYEPYFVKISNCEHSRSLLSFDPSLQRWHNVPISYLPSEVDFPVSSSGGLICFINKLHAHMGDECGSVLFVSNPLTKAWRELPRFLCKQRPILVSMIMWKRPSHYKVIVAGVVSTEIFDSMEGEWRNAGCLPRGEEVSRNVAYCSGNLYCLTPRWYNCVLLAFSLQGEVWSRVKTGRLPGYCQFRNLVTCKGHIVIVGKSVRHQVLSLCVWLLEWRTMKWREAGRMPQRMSDHFLGRPSESFDCCSHGDLIFLTRDKCDMGLLFDLGRTCGAGSSAAPTSTASPLNLAWTLRCSISLVVHQSVPFLIDESNQVSHNAHVLPSLAMNYRIATVLLVQSRPNFGRGSCSA